jgi:curved DNA-binding protein CbpA
MTGEPDLYAVLGVQPDAAPADISRAYRELVRRHHPDRAAESTPDAEALDQVVTAYAVLRDPERRAEYDKRRRPIRRVRRVSQPVNPPPSRDEPPIRVGPVRYHRPPH